MFGRVLNSWSAKSSTRVQQKEIQHSNDRIQIVETPQKRLVLKEKIRLESLGRNCTWQKYLDEYKKSSRVMQSISSDDQVNACIPYYID